MSASLAQDVTCGRRLTAAALQLLDVPFDAASPASGEVFDHVIDALSMALTRASAVEQGAFTPEPYRRPCVPAASRGDQRRAQAALRASLARRHLTGNAASLRRAEQQLEAVGHVLEALLRTSPGAGGLNHSAPLVAVVRADLLSLHALVRGYTIGYLRLAQSVGTTSDLALLEESAVRAERRLMQALRALCEPG